MAGFCTFISTLRPIFRCILKPQFLFLRPIASIFLTVALQFLMAWLPHLFMAVRAQKRQQKQCANFDLLKMYISTKCQLPVNTATSTIRNVGTIICDRLLHIVSNPTLKYAYATPRYRIQTRTCKPRIGCRYTFSALFCKNADQ